MPKFLAKFTKNRPAQLLIIVCLTILAYINIFQNQFIIDDKVFILRWQAIKSFADIGSLLSGAVPAGHEGVYRPLRSLFYLLYYHMFGTNAFFYHLHSLTIHLLSTLLVYLIVKHISAKKGLAFVGALIFGLHPIHTETITYISASMEATGIVFFLASFYLYLKENSAKIKVKSEKLQFKVQSFSSVALALLAFFTYEMTLTLPLLIITYDLILGGLRKNHSNLPKPNHAVGDPAERGVQNRLLRCGAPRAERVGRNPEPKAKTTHPRVKPMAFWFMGERSAKLSGKSIPYLIGAGIYIAIRFFVLQITKRGPYLANSWYLTVLTMSKVLVKYLSLTILPINQANNHIISKGIEAFVYRGYRTEAIRAQSLTDFSILFSFFLIFITLLLAFRIRKKNPIISFSILWFFISLLPVSEIVPQGSILNEKFLYLPSFGLILIFSYFLTKWVKKEVFLVVLIGLSLLLGSLTFRRNKDWQNEITLWSKDISLYPEDNAYAYFALGNVYREKGELKQALSNYQKSFAINPHFAVAMASIGKTYQDSGRINFAITSYQKAIEIDPLFWEAHFNLANIYLKQGKVDLAAWEYQQALNINPNLPAHPPFKDGP